MSGSPGWQTVSSIGVEHANSPVTNYIDYATIGLNTSGQARTDPSMVQLSDGKILCCFNYDAEYAARASTNRPTEVWLVEASDESALLTTLAFDTNARMFVQHGEATVHSPTTPSSFPMVMGEIYWGPDGALWLGLSSTRVQSGGSHTYDSSVSGGSDFDEVGGSQFFRSTDEGTTWTAYSNVFWASYRRTYEEPDYFPEYADDDAQILYGKGGVQTFSPPSCPAKHPWYDYYYCWIPLFDRGNSNSGDHSGTPNDWDGDPPIGPSPAWKISLAISYQGFSGNPKFNVDGARLPTWWTKDDSDPVGKTWHNYAGYTESTSGDKKTTNTFPWYLHGWRSSTSVTWPHYHDQVTPATYPPIMHYDGGQSGASSKFISHVIPRPVIPEVDHIYDSYPPFTGDNASTYVVEKDSITNGIDAVRGSPGCFGYVGQQIFVCLGHQIFKYTTSPSDPGEGPEFLDFDLELSPRFSGYSGSHQVTSWMKTNSYMVFVGTKRLYILGRGIDWWVDKAGLNEGDQWS